MSTTRRSGLLAAAILLLVSGFVVLHAGAARADVQSFSDSVPIQNTNWNETLSIPQFDPAQGTLQSVEVSITGDLAGTSQVENLDPSGPTSATLELTATVDVDGDPGGGVITIPTNPTSSNTATLDPFDGTIDFGGPSGATFAGLTGTETNSQTITDPGVLAAYTGTGTVSLDASASANSTATGGGNVAAFFDTDAGASVTVTYTFQAAANPGIDIEKATNGADADAAPGPTLTVGQTVNWTYEVTNTGNVELTNVAVSDDQGVAVSCPQTTLAAGASMTCTASGTATAGQYTNIGSATADSSGGPVTDTDPSNYFGEAAAAPAVEIQKTPDAQTVVSGSDVTFTITVTNTGNVALTEVAVSDPLAPGCDATIGDLAVGASTSYDCTVAGVTAAFTNVATVTGEAPGGEDVTDEDDAAVEIAAISVLKVANATSASAGDQVTYTYTVTNTGTVTLTDISLVDDKLGAVTLATTTLAPGESTTGTATATVASTDLPGPLVNVATVTGEGPGGEQVTDQDDATVPLVAVLPVTTTPPATLPATGLDTDQAAGLGLILISLGMLALAAALFGGAGRLRLAPDGLGGRLRANLLPLSPTERMAVRRHRVAAWWVRRRSHSRFRRIR